MSLTADDGIAVLTRVINGVSIQDRISQDGSVDRVEHRLDVDRAGVSAVSFLHVDSAIVIFTDDLGALQWFELPSEG